jgi:hypothetical protein
VIGALVRVAKANVVTLVKAIDGAIATIGDELGRIFTALIVDLSPA